MPPGDYPRPPDAPEGRYDDELWEAVPEDPGPPPRHLVRFVEGLGPAARALDLGCGDGRLVITAVKQFGARRGVGVDIDPQRIKESNENAKAAGVTDRVEFRVQDLFETDFKEATVVTLYLLPDVNLKLRPKLLSDLKPGTRVVSHAFNMGDWEPDKTVTVEQGGQTLYLWTIPAKSAPAAGGGNAP